MFLALNLERSTITGNILTGRSRALALTFSARFFLSDFHFVTQTVLNASAARFFHDRYL
jgi:hypothetical protein